MLLRRRCRTVNCHKITSLDDNDSVVENNPRVLEEQPSDKSKKKAAVHQLEFNKYLTLPLLLRQQDPIFGGNNMIMNIQI